MLGDRLGNWIIERELGRGGMGRVYLVHHFETQQPAALKVLAAELAQEAGFRHRFQREIDALAVLEHPHIVRFYEAGEEGVRHFYAMEFVDGKDFDHLLREQGRIAWRAVLELTRQISSALKHAHDHGIIHRDLKPANLMQAADGVVKLADFGIAKVFAGKHLTVTGGLVGTAEYVSPEQAAGKPVTARSDLYSFGAVLYTLLTGRPPFKGDSVIDLLHKHRYGQFDAPKKLVTELPHDFDELICDLLAKEPDERPPNAQFLLRRVEGIRAKLERQDQLTVVSVPSELTRADAGSVPAIDNPGPATLMSQLMRQELDADRRAGPVGRFFNHPLVLIVLFVACVGLIIWGFLPASADSLYARGARLMASPDPADWETAFERYFAPLDSDFPDHPYGKQIEEYRAQLEDARAGKLDLKPGAQISPAEAFYLKGQRLYKEDDLLSAQAVWRNLAIAFAGIEAEARWVKLAQKRLQELRKRLPTTKEHEAVIDKAIAEDDPARKKALEFLYRDRPDLLQKMRDKK